MARLSMEMRIERIKILAQIDKLNKDRCPKCATTLNATKPCCPANIEGQRLGEELLKLRSTKATKNEVESYDYQYQLWKPVAIANGISSSTYGRRIRDMKMSFEDAATKPLFQPMEIPEDILNIAIANGLKKRDVVYRLKNGWTIHDAANTPSRYKTQN